MSKRFILISVVIIGILAFSFYIFNNQGTKPCDKLVNKLRDVYGNIFQKNYIPLYVKSKSGKCYRLRILDDDTNLEQSHNNNTQIEKNRFDRNETIEWFIISFIIITIMSLPINILWRFRLKIPAFLFTIMTVLAVIAIPFIFY